MILGSQYLSTLGYCLKLEETALNHGPHIEGGYRFLDFNNYYVF